VSRRYATLDRMSATELVRRLYESYQARDWATAESLMHQDASVELPATAERLTGRPQVMQFQYEYPEPWGEMQVLSTVGDDLSAAAEVQVLAPDGQQFRMAAFWQVRDGLLWCGTEYWLTAGSEAPPANRTSYAQGS
jgi:ketosteroid isomerase-like protein